MINAWPTTSSSIWQKTPEEHLVGNPRSRRRIRPSLRSNSRGLTPDLRMICLNRLSALCRHPQASKLKSHALITSKLSYSSLFCAELPDWPRANVLYLALFVILKATIMASQAGAADVNSSNNPLTQVVTVQIQDYISPYVNRLNGTGNQLQARGLVPFQLFGTDQLARVTAPVETLPQASGTSTTGLSNFQVFDLTLIPTSIATFGVGPLLVAPTAGNSALGTDRWQAGAAGVAVMPGKWGLFAQVLTYQHSFGGGHGEGPTSLLTYQPILTYNLANDFYLRSSGLMSFDFERHSTVIPLGFGAGKVWQLSPRVRLNVFVEPQYSVIHSGVGVPLFQIYTGGVFQFTL